ncbi:hypothetical protein DAPPUDRAFT_312582 [Daphnia pulex]|uniref:Tudor domain-containing protein n=1 Tax=Daphnia pulex TaxID=6669 RepID=E9FZJ4_DAPPU|nr:hypothetical protein DAPPUDRAFT_312582 [Daphnia pulex]|eukprot:EFX87066.1 hypothetical protein DAPPUDRAFT_312582 [Daphnia pulex]
MAAASMLVNVTHIDDSVRGRQGPCVYFWGSTHDRSLYLTMELYLESIRQHLESKVPPMNLSELDSNEMFCVLINHRWHRVTVPELKLNRTGMLEVYCVDSGKTHTVPLIFLRTLDIPGYEAENIRDCPPLASKFILADAVAPFGLGTHTRQWSDLAMTFLKIHVENVIWKAIPMAMYGEHQGVRLFDSNNQLLASALVQQGLGVAAQSYHEALAMCETMEKQPSFMKPAFYSYPVMKLFPAGCTSLSFPLRPNFAIPSAQQNLPDVSTRTYVTNNLPLKERYDVVVTHISEGPFKFFVRMKRETRNLQEIRKHLDSIAPTPFQGTPLGSACIAVSPSDKLFHRGLITGMKDFGTPSCKYSVFFVDIGTQIPIDRALIYDIPDELLVPCLCAYRVSLFGVENISKLDGLNQIFAALVNKESDLQAEVEDDEGQQISLYISGRSICDMLAAIYSNLQDNSPNSSMTSNSTLLLSTVAVPFSVVQMPPLNLAAEESLFVSVAGTSGYFFGQLEEIRLPNSRTGFGLKDLNDMADELKNAYSTQANPPLLYAGSESRLGHHGVVIWEEDGVYYRVRVTKEMENEVEILFIDFGNTIVVPRNTILSPIKSLTRFCHPPYGIHCKLEEGVTLPSQKWKHLIVDRWIKVKIGRCVEGIYSVTFTSDLGNGIIATKIQNALSRPNAVETVNTQKKQTESAVLESVAKILTSIPISDDRLIKSSNNGNFSVTIKNSPCINEKISETTVIETDKRLSQPAFIESDLPRDLLKIDGVSNQDIVETEAKEMLEPEILPQTSEMEPLSKEPEFSSKVIPGPVSTCTTIPQQSSSVGNEIPKVLNQEEKQELTGNLPAVKSDIESATQELQEVNDAPGRLRPLTSHQQQLSYPEQVDVPINQQVEVVYVNNPSSFYLQLLESCTVLEQLGTNLNAVYSDESKPSIADLKVGSACVVQYEEDKGWYRGKILKFCDPHGATVLFVDYGNTQLAPVEQIKSIDEEFMKLPPLAYHCRLDGVDASCDWTVEEKKKFEGRTMTKLFSATFTLRDSEGKYPVRLVEETKKANIAINEEFGAPNFTNIPPPSSGYTSRSVPDKPISVVVSCCVNPFRFYLSPNDDRYQNQLEELEKFYSSLSPNDLHEYQPSLGLPCVARFTEDGRYYRSQILSIVDDIADILFVDYGNQQKTHLSELKRITPCFMEFPQMTWQCKLKGVKKSSPICPDFQKHIDTCFATNEELSALFHATSSGENDGVFEVDLAVPKIGDASQYLIEKNVVERVSLEADVELGAQDVNFAPQQIISTNAITLCFKSPAEFWVQFDPSSVNDLMARLDKLALDPQFLNKKDFIPSVGKPCLAFYEVDKRWYRAKVEAVKEDCVTICYVDYGNSCDVKSCDLRGLPNEFAQQPALGFKCCQDGFENFSESASKIFEEIVMDLESFSVKFLKLVDGVLCVRLSHGESDVGELCSSVKTQPLQEEEPVKSGAVVSASAVSADEVFVDGHVANPLILESPNVSVDHEVPQELVAVSSVNSVMVDESITNPVEVEVVYAPSPGQFWVQLKKDQEELIKMEADISGDYSKNSDSLKIKTKPTVGQIYGVLHPLYESWFRAQIKEVYDDDTADVFFVDYGDSFKAPFVNICTLGNLFADIPVFAVRCSLNKPLIEWSEAAVNKFVTDCTGKVSRAVFGAKENGLQFVESLHVGDDNKNIFDLLVGL